MAFKRCSIGTKGPKVCQENIPHTITPPAALARTIETRQDGSMLSCSLRQILTLPPEHRSRNRDSSDLSKSLKNLFLPHSDARFELQQIVFTTSRCNELISNLCYQAIEQVYLKKVAGECVYILHFTLILFLLVNVQLIMPIKVIWIERESEWEQERENRYANCDSFLQVY